MSRHLLTSEEVVVRNEGIVVPTRKYLKFVGADVSDDDTNDRTVVSAPLGADVEVPLTLTTSSLVTPVGTTPQWTTADGDTSYLDFVPTGSFATADFTVPAGLSDAAFATLTLRVSSKSMNVVPDDTYFYIYLMDTDLGTVARWTYTPTLGSYDVLTFTISEADQYDLADILVAYHAGRLEVSAWAGGGSGNGDPTDALRLSHIALSVQAPVESASIDSGGYIGYVRYTGGPYTISNVSGSYVNAGTLLESGGSTSWLNMDYSGPNTSLWYFKEHGLYRYTLDVTFQASASLGSTSQFGIRPEVFFGTQRTARSYMVMEGVRIHRSHATDALTTWRASISITDYFGPGSQPGESGIINTQYVKYTSMPSVSDVYTETWIARIL